MIVNTPISLGDLIDKISILIIKEKKITDEKKNNHIPARGNGGIGTFGRTMTRDS